MMRTHSNTKREAILDGARRVFLAHGYSGTSMEAIAEAAPVAKPTLYSYFGNKHELFVAVVVGQCDTLFSTLSEASLKHPNHMDGLRAIAEEFVALIYSPESLALYRLLIAEQAHFPELGEQVYRASAEPMIEMLSRYLEKISPSGQVYAEDAKVSSELFLGMLHGVSHCRCLMGLQTGLSEQERHQLIEGAVSLFIKGNQP
jgi:TetR/AcrR family transcriptional repressor of mexJK operon